VIDLAGLNAQHGTDFRHIGAYDGGEFGALRLVDGEGNRFVFKSQPPGLAPETTDSLRPLGYPVPHYVVWGADYHVQAELPGRPAWRGWGVAAASDIIARLLELNELQERRAVDGDESWPDSIVERYSDESRELLRLCRRAVERHADQVRGRRDIVHWDYTLSNVLLEGDRVTGVIDWGGTRTGDRLLDLATLIYYAKGEAPDLEQYVLERIGREGLSVYLAHMCVRQSDFSVRHHGIGEGESVIDYSLELARRFP
jgi:Phosphotransferase enzyme family